MLPIILSIGAIYAFIPIIVIIILIAAAAGLMRGTDIFALFGIGTLMGMASGIGKGAGKGLGSGNKYRSTPAKFLPGGTKGGVAGLLGKPTKQVLHMAYHAIKEAHAEKKEVKAEKHLERMENEMGTSSKAPLSTPNSKMVRLAVFSGALGNYRLKKYNKSKGILEEYKKGENVKPSKLSKASKTIIKIDKKQVRKENRYQRKNWEDYASSKKELKVAQKMSKREFKKEVNKAVGEANIKSAWERFSSNYKKMVSDKSAKTPYLGPFFALIEEAPKEIKGALSESIDMAKRQKLSNKNELLERKELANEVGFKEEDRIDVAFRFEEEYLKKHGNIWLGRWAHANEVELINPQKLVSYKNGEYEWNIESLPDRLKAKAEEEWQKARVSESDKDRREHVQKAQYYESVLGSASKYSQQLSKSLQSRIERGFLASRGLSPDKASDYYNYIINSRSMAEEPEGFTPQSPKSFYIEEWGYYRDSVIQPKTPLHRRRANK